MSDEMMSGRPMGIRVNGACPAAPAAPDDVFFWRQEKQLGNFGDALTLVFLERLFSGPCLYADHAVHLIGSVITPGRVESAVDPVTGRGVDDRRLLFWGCGMKSDQPLPAHARRRCAFLGVRGLLTRDALGLPRDTPLGDPALLLPRIYRPIDAPTVRGKVLWVPHTHYCDPTDQDLDGCPDHVVMRPEIPNTVAACERFIDAIASARFVMANAMHAAIVALAYGTPFAFWAGGGIDAPFKWRDFTSVIGTDPDFHRTYAAAWAAFERARPDRALSGVDLGALLRVAPYKLQSHL